MGFEEILDTIMRMQNGNYASVADVVELRKYFSQSMKHLQASVDEGFAWRLSRTRAFSEVVEEAPRLVDVQFFGLDREKVVRHTTSLTIKQMLQQFAPEHGQLVASDSSGVELGAEVSL